ncbi:MAG: DNA-processing protein DprA [Acidobacteriota bacterium]|nr:DNA-processing protein DprA [Acidobacteriota bacterium]MDQ7087891.1 DNA-processing protein DprA [Acidobacteriota bacterium]
MAMRDPHLEGWLRLARCRGIGARRAATLAERAGGADFLADPEPQWLERRGLNEATCRRLSEHRLSRAVKAELRWARRHGWSHVHRDHPLYPRQLAAIDDPPPVLCCRGDTSLLREIPVALVGSRRPTRYGLTMAARLAAPLAARGLVVVSGLAEGIDAESHRAALEGGGATLAVMATGPDRVYPTAHRALAERIARRGLLLTEAAPGASVSPGCFPRRNRIISGLSWVVVVVEAAERSGSLVTADLAAEQGREVLAVPGRLNEASAAGVIRLLDEGAGLALGPDDVIAALNPVLRPFLEQQPADDPLAQGRPPMPGLPDEDCRAVYDLLPENDPLELDAILARAEAETDAVLTMLFSLEMAGWIERLPGNRYARCRTDSAQRRRGAMLDP